MTAPIVPTVHLNGTTGEVLLEQQGVALEAIREAIDALCKAGPNARDYYLQGPDVALAAQREHEFRVNALRQVRDQVAAIRDGIQDQLDVRDAHRRAR